MKRWLMLAATLATVWCSPASRAQALACGVYVDADSGARLEVLDPDRARIVREEMPPVSLRYRRDGVRLTLYDIEAGHSERYLLSADLRSVRSDAAAFPKTFVLARALACATDERPPPGRCERDLDACFATIDEFDDAALADACAQGLPFACVKSIDRERSRMRPLAASEPPPACREGAPGFDADACEAAVGRLIGEAFASAVGAMQDDPAPLPAARLDTLPALCERSGTAKVCGRVAEELWAGARYAQARDALAIACERGMDPDACRRVAPFAGLSAAALRTEDAKALPCGRYVADSGLMREFEFGDRGLATALGDQLRARLEGGAIRLRHDKGGDFVLRALADDRLIGIDRWNRYALYRRAGGATACAAPVTYAETPLIEDCPQPGAKRPHACCDAGSLHGCNILGHQLALAGRWNDARPYYLKVCAAGVRIGCENLAKAYAEDDGERIVEDLRALCARDDRHVACDVVETTDWAAMLATRAFAEALREIEAEDAQRADGQEAGRHETPREDPPR